MEFTWSVVYEDGVEHTESEYESSTERIDRSRLAEFRIYTGGTKVFTVYFTKSSRKLIFRRRRILNINDPQDVRTITIVGWHEKVKGESVITVCYINDNGVIEFDDDRNNLVLIQSEL